MLVPHFHVWSLMNVLMDLNSLLVYFVYTCGMSGSWVGEAPLC